MSFEQLDFATFCIGAVSERLGISQGDVFNKLKDSGILSGYIVPAYSVLHSFSRDYIVDDLVALMRERGVLA